MSDIMAGASNRKFTPLFENLHLNPYILGNICFLNKYLRIPCVVGKSMLMRKADLETLGGLRAFHDALAEDYLIGKKMKRRGYKVIVSNYLISNVNEYWGI
jgi:ceramide glucosyltransferase